VWASILPIVLTEDTHAITLLVQAANPPELNSQQAQLILRAKGNALNTSSWKGINIESRHDSQVRKWKTNLLDTGGTVVSLITAVFVGIKQLEEEKKRQKGERIRQVIATFDTDVKNDISKVFKEHLEMTTDWNEWDKALQDQFCDRYSSFIEDELWNVLADKALLEMLHHVEQCLQICERIFDNEEVKSLSTIKQLQSAIMEKDQSALKSFLNEYPESGTLVQQIAKIISSEPIIIGIERIPRQGQISSMAKRYDVNDKLSTWLEKRQMLFSPFLDTSNAFTLLPKENKMLMQLASPRFVFDGTAYQNGQLRFSTFWDLSAGLFEYLKQIPPKVKHDTFIILSTQDMFTDFNGEPSIELFFHALAEAWFWEITEDWSTYYSFTLPQRGLIGRLLCWHGNSPDAILSRFELSFGEQDRNNNTQKILLQIIDWLKNTDSKHLQPGEMKSLIGLRPLSKHRSLLVNSTSAAINPFIEKQTNWFNKQAWCVANFRISVSGSCLVSTTDIIQQCNERVNLCSHNLIQGFDELFIPYDEEPADLLLARKAAGSPGKMVRLGQKLLLQHVEKYSLDEPLHIEDLITLE
jgi:hypothetical protein